GQFATRHDFENGPIVGIRTAKSCRAIEIAVGSERQRRLRIAAIGTAEGVQDGKLAVRRDAKDRAIITVRAASLRRAVQLTIPSLDQSCHRKLAIRAAKRMKHSQHACWRNSINGAEVAVIAV